MMAHTHRLRCVPVLIHLSGSVDCKHASVAVCWMKHHSHRCAGTVWCGRAQQLHVQRPSRRATQPCLRLWSWGVQRNCVDE